MSLYYAFVTQVFHCCTVHAQRAEHFRVVLTQFRRDRTYSDAVANADRGADMRHPAQFVVIGIDHHFAMLHLRVGEELLTGPQGTPAAASTSTQCSVEAVVSTASISASSAGRFFIRVWPVTKRSSSHHSAWSRASAQRRQIDWPPAPIMM